MSTLRLGTRGSRLAMFQATLVAERIRAASGQTCEIVIIKTSGDRLQELPLSEIGGKRLFVKEIEDALLKGDVDLAVHSSKDMPAELPDGLDLGAVLEREDPRDALVRPSSIVERPSSIVERPSSIVERPSSIVERTSSSGDRLRIGTGSVRRVAQLRGRFPDASFENVRGNLDTRLRKLDSGGYDLLVLAAAGLRRLGFGSRISEALPIDECVPAPGQGIIAVEIRADDEATRQAVAPIDNGDAAASLAAERSLVSALGGGCQMPIGGIATPSGSGSLEMTGLVSSLDGARVIRYKKAGPRSNPAALGRDVAEELLRQGAAEILRLT